MRYAAFWVYNLVVCAYVLNAVRSKVVERTQIAFGINVALIVCAVGVIAGLGESARAKGFFNNPNQLSYYALVALSMSLYMSQFRLKGGVLYLLALGAGVISVLSGASISAIVGFSFLALGVLLRNVTSVKGVISVAIGMAVVVLLVVLGNVVSGGAIESIVEKRIARLDDKVENVYEDRKLHRLVNHPEQLFAGAGEAHHLERFGDRTEIHNAYANVLFNYGVIGFVAFLSIFGVLALRSSKFEVLAVMGPMVYNFTHMGLRSTMFWLLVSFVFYDTLLRRKTTRNYNIRSVAGGQGA